VVLLLFSVTDAGGHNFFPILGSAIAAIVAGLMQLGMAQAANALIELERRTRPQDSR
jgi:hypothetical protein